MYREEGDREQRLKEYEARTGRMEATGEILEEEIPEGDMTPEKRASIDRVLTRLEEHNENPIYGTTFGATGLGPGLGSAMAEAGRGLPYGASRGAVMNRQYFERLTTEIVFRVLKPLSEEGRLTKDDFENLRDMAGQPSDDIRLRKKLTDNIRSALDDLDPKGSNPTEWTKNYDWMAGWVGAAEGGGAETGAMPSEEEIEALVGRAEQGDERALAELKRLKLIG
jgi:hypothetical protein